MARSSIRHGCVITCDIPACNERHLTYSMASFARKQTELAGWKRTRRRLLGVNGEPLDFAGRNFDLCATHANLATDPIVKKPKEPKPPKAPKVPKAKKQKQKPQEESPQP